MNIKQIATLYAKLGLFYSACDGTIDESEKDFLNRFFVGLRKSNEFKDLIDDNLKDDFDNLYKQKITFEEIVLETKELLKDLKEEEKPLVLKTLTDFINQVIESNGIVEKIEAEYLNKWKTTFHL